ncbi:hypothetical protein HanXRQr2_Chr04g0187351 [Helianthus annuus]|uniref:Uncharacterized protein n=1 Tax=Helianthus annuus TaxID=4232 RepID=A0A251V2L0_HELAN|nr:hypothetical protein HanXRQr2_Chr04g0187351 [Helianthus annuus]
MSTAITASGWWLWAFRLYIQIFTSNFSKQFCGQRDPITPVKQFLFDLSQIIIHPLIVIISNRVFKYLPGDLAVEWLHILQTNFFSKHIF